ncbi:hypothetical protein NQZ68_031652 [Dissostichus eleginoides]|nr:hypothetical protein NQZ68_031652 [Dissostichus eleginoides]
MNGNPREIGLVGSNPCTRPAPLPMCSGLHAKPQRQASAPGLITGPAGTAPGIEGVLPPFLKAIDSTGKHDILLANRLVLLAAYKPA